VVVFVILGVILVVVVVVLYVVLAGKHTANPQAPTRPLKSQTRQVAPEPHVLRIAIDWPPKPPTSLLTKTGYNLLQAQEPTHQA
jgi:hypothetical protein